MRNPWSATTSSSSSKGACCSSKVGGLKRGPWTPEEDEVLANYIKTQGEGRWRTLPKRAGLLRCGKSCRLRWMNYLRPCLKRGHIAPDEEDLILRLHRLLGNRWSLIAGRIPGRTDNEIKNYWNTHLSKKLISQGIDPRTHKPLTTATKPSSTSKPNITNNNIINPSSLAPQNPAVAATAAAASSASEESNTNIATTAAAAAASDRKSSRIHAAVLNKATAALGYFGTATYSSFDHNHRGILVSNNGGGQHHLQLHHLEDHHKSASGLIVNNNNNNCGNTNALISASLEEDVNCCPDDVFSSFLNSLINEDMFTAQNQLLPQQQPPNGLGSDVLVSHPCAQTTTDQAAAFDSGAAGWDVPLSLPFQPK